MEKLNELRNFMYDVGYTQTDIKDEKYVRKDGKVTPVKRVTFSNGKDYLVSQNRFWKVN
jgi:hypothetical protein